MIRAGVEAHRLDAEKPVRDNRRKLSGKPFSRAPGHRIISSRERKRPCTGEALP